MDLGEGTLVFYALYIDKFPNKKNETTKKYEPIKLKKEKVESKNGLIKRFQETILGVQVLL